MDGILDSIIGLLPVPTVFEMSFGLIISIVLFLIDRGEKARQEETLRRQDESLDIILEQVSKVNVFQTRTLSLAIESLSNELNTFKSDIELIKFSILDQKDDPYIKKDDLSSNSTSQIEKEQVQEIETKPSIKFGEVLSKQVNSFINQIKHDISSLAKSEAKGADPKNLYKTKKSLEFDIKDLLNIQSMIDDINSEPLSEEESDEIHPSKSSDSNFGARSTNEDSPEDKMKLESKPSVIKENKSELDEQFDRLNSIPDLVKFTENFINKFEELNTLFTNSEQKNNNFKPQRKKITPNKKISKSDIDKQNNEDLN